MNPQQIAVIVQNELTKAFEKISTKTFYRAVIQAVGTNNRVNVYMEGSTNVHPNILCMSGYQAVVGDKVLIINLGMTGSNFICMGRVNVEGTSGDPIGEIQMTLKAVADTGFLLLNGGTYNKADYPAMTAVITSNGAYGTLGSTTFTLTTMVDFVPVGKNSTGTFASLGATGGEQTHTLSGYEMPVHSHGGPNSAPIMYDPGISDTRWGLLFQTTGGYHATGGYLSNAGGGGAHNNLQPFKVVNYQVRAR